MSRIKVEEIRINDNTTADELQKLGFKRPKNEEYYVKKMGNFSIGVDNRSCYNKTGEIKIIDTAGHEIYNLGFLYDLFKLGYVEKVKEDKQ